MNFLEYSNMYHCNIIPKESFNELIEEVFGVISQNLIKSLGPAGSSTTILDGLMTSATKDGHAIFKSIRFHNRYKSMIYNLISAPCTFLNNTVGDGTTTAIVLTDFLFRDYQGSPATEKREAIVGKKYSLEKFYRLPRQLTKAWDEVVEAITERVQTYAKPLDPDDYDSIYNICYVTSNGNDEISKNIADVYETAKSPSIKMKPSPTNKSYIEPITGFDFPANLIDDCYIKNEDLSVELKDVAVMIFNFKIETDVFQEFLVPLNEIFKSRGKKLIVIAPFYDALMSNTTLKLYMNMEYQKYKDLNLVLTQYAISKLDEHQLTDLAVILKATIIDQDLMKDIREVIKFGEKSDGEKYDFIESTEDSSHSDSKYYGIIGSASSALMSCTNGSIFRVDDIENNERYQDILRGAERELQLVTSQTDNEKQSYAFKIAKAKSRVSQLKMNNYIYYIGANSALQKNIIEDTVDDVIKCIRSAVKSGTVPGCQLSIIKAVNEIITELAGDAKELKDLTDEVKLKIAIADMIQLAVVNVYVSILHGADGQGMIKLVPMWEHVGVTDDGRKELIEAAKKKAVEIVEESLKRNQVFDLESLDYSDNIITSAETDINVLLASSELVKLLISGNQCVFLDADINSTHNETVKM